MAWRRKETGHRRPWCLICWTESIRSPHVEGQSVWSMNVYPQNHVVWAWWHHPHFPHCWPFVRGNSPVPGEFPSQRPGTGSFDVFFDLRLIKWLCKQSRRRWFEMPSQKDPCWLEKNTSHVQHFGVIYTENCELSWGQLWRHRCNQRRKSWHYNNSVFMQWR